jgi:hypothetical protein
VLKKGLASIADPVERKVTGTRRIGEKKGQLFGKEGGKRNVVML